MNKKVIIFVSAVIIFGFGSSLHAQFGLEEVRVMGGLSQTTVPLPTITVENAALFPINKNFKKTGIPVGVRFGLGAPNMGFLVAFGGFLQPMFGGNQAAHYYTQPGILGSGYIENSLFDAGFMVELLYRFKKYVPGFYVGGGVSGHRITSTSTFSPPYYPDPEIAFPVPSTDNSGFRTGFQIVVGYKLYKSLDLEGRYEAVNDFNQYKLGLTVALWSHE